MATPGQLIKLLQLFQEVPSDRLQKILESGELAKVRDGQIVSRAVCLFPIWKTIQLGIHKDVKALSKAIVAKKSCISDWGKDILKRISVSSKETEIDLVKLTVVELGFPKGATREQIYAKAKELGLDLCPAEVGPQLRLQYQDQLYEEWILIGMEPILDSYADSRIFRVGHNCDACWLHSTYGNPDGVWRPEGVWVFACRK